MKLYRFAKSKVEIPTIEKVISISLPTLKCHQWGVNMARLCTMNNDQVVVSDSNFQVWKPRFKGVLTRILFPPCASSLFLTCLRYSGVCICIWLHALPFFPFIPMRGRPHNGPGPRSCPFYNDLTGKSHQTSLLRARKILLK